MKLNTTLLSDPSALTTSLQSKGTAIKRVIHVFAVVIGLYSMGYVIAQYHYFFTLDSQQHTPFGSSSNPYFAIQRNADLLAKQWLLTEKQDSKAKNQLLQSWLNLDAVIYVGVFNSKGKRLAQLPQKEKLTDILQRHPQAITANATFSLDEASGTISLVVDNTKMKQSQVLKDELIIKTMLASFALGGLCGVYLFRGLIKLRGKALK